MKKRQLEVPGWSFMDETQILTADSVILFIIWRSQDFRVEWNIYKNFRWMWMQNWVKKGGKWAPSHLPFVNIGEGRKKKANRQLYRHFLSVGQWVYPTTASWGATFILKTSPSQSYYNTDNPLLKCRFTTRHSSNSTPCLHVWTATIVNFSFKPKVLRQVYSFFLSIS